MKKKLLWLFRPNTGEVIVFPIIMIFTLGFSSGIAKKYFDFDMMENEYVINGYNTIFFIWLVYLIIFSILNRGEKKTYKLYHESGYERL